MAMQRWDRIHRDKPHRRRSGRRRLSFLAVHAGEICKRRHGTVLRLSQRRLRRQQRDGSAFVCRTSLREAIAKEMKGAYQGQVAEIDCG
jgi:hypothetical protein